MCIVGFVRGFFSPCLSHMIVCIALNRLYQIVEEPTSKEMGADRPATSLLTFSFKSDQNNNGRYFWLCRLISEAREESVHLVYTPFMGVLLLYSSM